MQCQQHTTDSGELYYSATVAGRRLHITWDEERGMYAVVDADTWVVLCYWANPPGTSLEDLYHLEKVA